MLVAPFLAIACLTGIVYVFSPQLSDLVYSHELLVGPHTGAPRPLDEQVAAAAAAHPEGTLNSLVVDSDPGRTTGVVLDVDGLPEDTQRTVYVDPYTAGVRGSLDTWFDTPPLQTTLDALHRNLLLGEPGRLYSELAASWLWVVVLGGLALWIGKRRGRRKAAAALLPPRRMRPGRRRIVGWHGATGVWLTVALLFLSATGLTWSNYAGGRFSTFVDAVKGSTPTLRAEPVPLRDAPLISVQDAVDRARGGGLEGPLKVAPPAEPGTPFTVAEIARDWPVQRDEVALDSYTGAVTETIVWRDFPVLAKLTRIGILAHMGSLFGLVSPARAGRDRARAAQPHLLGLPHVVAAPPHPQRLPAHPARSARHAPRPVPARLLRRRAARRGRRLDAPGPRREPGGLPGGRRRSGRTRPTARGPGGVVRAVSGRAAASRDRLTDAVEARPGTCAAMSPSAGTSRPVPSPARRPSMSPAPTAGISVTDPWVKTAENGMTPVFGTLTATGSTPVTIVSARTSASAHTELHEVVMSDGAMKMRPKEGGFVVEPGEPHTLAPGGDHIMIMDLATPACGSEPAGATPRNLMGQRDGSANPPSGSTERDEAVWVRGGPDWLVGGCMLVLRRIRMDLDIWDDFGRPGKEMAMARRLDTGAPVTGGGEFGDVDPRMVDGQGLPIAIGDAHVLRATARDPTEKMLRRGFSFDDGPTPDGLPDAGLLFAACQADAATAFVPVQTRLAESDVMNLWITHSGSAAFAVPPGCTPGEYVGQHLLEYA